MDEEPERAKRWEEGYERAWEILKEDESGSLKATVENILFKAKRKRHLDSSGSGPSLTLGGYYCPQCRAKCTELPVECKVCGLTLVSAPHLVRSFHHLFPLELSQKHLYKTTKDKSMFCQGCQGELNDQNVYMCMSCQSVFCVECDLFIHESLHCCPSCIHSQPSPPGV
ncbi:TF2H2 factor, partial [Polyodon spathula]|nr:TF2H2 factor [Polyodon spathula]